jgi:hypothetical protein
MGKAVAIADALEVKHRLIDKAREQVENGAHYLMAAAGATPGQRDGASYRPGRVNLQKNVPDLNQDGTQVLPKGPPYAPTLFTAWSETGDGQIVCTGRAGLASVQQSPLAIDIKDHDALRLTLKKLTAAQIDELVENSNTPSLYRWPRQQSPRDRVPGEISTIWGESCLNTRHFDCIGLVNYCYSWALNQTWSYSIANFVNGNAGTVPIDKTRAEAGDIVTINTEHIGIVTFEKTVIEARDSDNGVIELPLTNTGWTHCLRLSANQWRLGPS